MIIDTKTKIKLTKKLINKYNYNGNPGDVIEIDIENLPNNSMKLIKVKCDICESERSLPYRTYMKNYLKYNLYTCYGCSRIKYEKTSIIKFGVNNPMQNDEIKNRLKDTILNKYGREFYLQTDDKKEKGTQTCLTKYGVENPMQDTKIKNKAKNTKREKYGDHYEKITEKIIKTKKEKYGEHYEKITEKINLTNVKKYGCDYPLQNKDIYNKSIETSINKYGMHPNKCSFIKDKQLTTLSNTTFQKIKNKYPDINFISKENCQYTIKCDDCGLEYKISFNLFFLRKSNNITLCTLCNDPKLKHKSDFEHQVINFLEKNEVKCQPNYRKILNGKEVDIYLPDYNMAIECNGIFWHSELYKSKNYHKNKSEECKKVGVELLHIWEDDWIYKQDIIKSIILNKLGKIKNKIYARKCEILEINDNNMVKNFLDENHIQGFVKSSFKIGLFYNKELVSLMTLGYRMINSKKEFELIRFCNKKYTNVIGSASRLFKNFIEKINKPFKIISYSDSSLFNGNMYLKIGFELIGDTSLNYYWVVDGIRNHRFKYNKKKLVMMGNDPNKTEYEIMTENNYYRIWSCGMKKWIYERN